MIKPSPAPRPRQKKSSPKNDTNRIGAIAKRLLIFVVAILSGGSLCFAINDGQMRFENYLYAQISQPINEIVYAVPKKQPKEELGLAAKAGISLRIDLPDQERVIFKKNADDVLPIASLTKLMTATVVFEHPEIYNAEKQIAISALGASQADVPVFGNLKPGEVYSVQELLGAMLFYSSNDAAYSLAEVIGVDRFTEMMNRKAKDIGLEKTGFYNSSGLDIDGGAANFSSAKDLLVLVKYILKSHPEIFSMTIHPGPYITENGIFSFKLWDKQTLIGGKTGYTEKAGGCMIAIFENENNRRYINILLGSASSESRVVEMQKMINYANNSDN